MHYQRKKKKKKAKGEGMLTTHTDKIVEYTHILSKRLESKRTGYRRIRIWIPEI